MFLSYVLIIFNPKDDWLLNCLTDIKNKSLFIKFYIIDICTFISKDILIKAINFGKIIIKIGPKVAGTILHARSSFLFNKSDTWIKKENSNFDISMENFDWGEVCELARLYLIDIPVNEFGKQSSSLYRDDCISYFQNLSGLALEKKLCELFKYHGVNITREYNLQVTINLQALTIVFGKVDFSHYFAFSISSPLYSILELILCTFPWANHSNIGLKGKGEGAIAKV